MDFASWIARTRAEGGKPRSVRLRFLDRAVKQYFASPNAAKLKALSGVLEKWKQSKAEGWENSIRNRDHAVEELDAFVKYEEMKLVQGSAFREAAAKARRIASSQELNGHSATVLWSQTISYRKGDQYKRWDAAKKEWVNERVTDVERLDREFPAKAHFVIVKRGTIVEVRVFCKPERGTSFPKDLMSRWTTAILSHWNHKAMLVDNGKTYELRFDLIWDPSHEGAYAIKRGNPPPNVHKWGIGILHEGLSSEMLYYSEVLELLLKASDEELDDLISKLEGPISIKKNLELRTFRKTMGRESAPLGVVLNALDSNDTYWVKSAVKSTPEGPLRIRDSRFRELIASGSLRDFTPVRKGTSGEWEKAASHRELKHFFMPNWERDERARMMDTTVNRGTFGEYDRKAICHEFGHMIGCPDEYTVTAISNTGQTWDPDIHDLPSFSSDSIMNNPIKGKIEVRHFACVLREYNRWQNAEATIFLKELPKEEGGKTGVRKEGSVHKRKVGAVPRKRRMGRR